MWLIGKWKTIEDRPDLGTIFVPYKGEYTNCYKDEQEAKDVLCILQINDPDLSIEELGPPQTMTLDLSQVSEIEEIE